MSVVAEKTLRHLLIEALRSGQYTQCRGRLRRGAAVCATAIACDVYGGGTWDGDWFVFDEPPGRHLIAAPIAVARAFHDAFHRPGILYEIQSMNDEGATFTEIADQLESLP